ncbi:hypothetical protein ES703_75720 [subsurface metagenome]
MTSTLWNYYLLHLGLGIGYVFLGPIPLSIIICNWFYRIRGTMQGLAFTGIGLGGLFIAAPIGNYLIPNLAMLAASYFGSKQYGSVLGIIHLFFFTGVAIGPMIAGFVFDFTGSYRLILLVIAAMCFAFVPLIAIIKRPQFLSN